jgi:signal transduction histidine kinase
MTMNRVLVVDDHLIVRKLVEKALSSRDLELAYARSGEEALRIADSFVPDLVILDIMMPGDIDGYEACRRIKSGGKSADAMVLLLSAKTSLESRLHGYEALADDYMIKPFDAKELAAKAGILLRLKNALDDLSMVNRNLTALVESRTRELVRKEQQAILGELVQGLAHNIRGPLTVVRARTELTASIAPSLPGGGDPSGAENHGEQVLRNQSLILEAVERIETLVNNLLDKSRKEASPQQQEIDLNALIQRELAFLESDPFIHRKLTKRFLPADGLPPVSGVYSDFSQVVYNLVKNAAEAMEHSERKELQIGTRYDDEQVVMEFVDSGSGIAPENMDRIFETFFSTKDGYGGGGGGTGLGLYTCRQLMRPYGAHIRAENNPDGGCRFIVEIPRRSVEAVARGN